MSGFYILIYTHSAVLKSCEEGEDSQAEPFAVFCVGELTGVVLLGDAGEEGCGVSVLSPVTSSASSSLCCTEDRYCASRLQSALSAPSLPPASESCSKLLRTGLRARTVFRESAVPLLRKLSSCSCRCSLVDWKPESGKEMSVLGRLVVLGAAGGAALQKAGDEA